MTAESAPSLASSGTQASDYSLSYYLGYHQTGNEDYDWESPSWRRFFQGVAQRLVATLAPSRTLDVGCAKGLLVQALLEHGVDAYGFDISEYAIESAHPDVRDRLSVGSATEPIEGRYDLISCIEVLEHLSPPEAQIAIDQICRATDRVLLSSTPGDFEESTHINVNPTAQWASWFAERGFFRRTDIDATFLTPWAIVFERRDLTPALLVEAYESLIAPLRLEVSAKRQALLDADRDLANARIRVRELESGPRFVEPDDARILGLHSQLTERDHLIGLEASIVRLTRDLETARARVRRMRARIGRLTEELAEVRQSTTWKIGRTVTRPLGKLRR